MSLPTLYQQYIHSSRYARWLWDEGRRERWEETVKRYFDFFQVFLKDSHNFDLKKQLRKELETAVLNLEVMPSMRCLMTAGEALAKDHMASYNCAFLAVDTPRAFDEILYILCCFHPDTKIQTISGLKKIKNVTSEDLVLTYDESKKIFTYATCSGSFVTKSSTTPKLELVFEDGTKVLCTENHKFLTSNRGWIEAKDLDENDDIVENSTYSIYKITNTINNKSYIGLSKDVSKRWKKHLYSSESKKTSAYDSVFYKALRKYDSSSWTLEIIDSARTLEEAKTLEKLYITKYNTWSGNQTGYNSTLGGEGSKHIWTIEQRKNASKAAKKREEEYSPEMREHLSKTRSKNMRKYRKENPLTAEQLEQARINNTGSKNPCWNRVMPEEERKWRSDRFSGSGNPFHGKEHSQKTKHRISKANKGKFSGGKNPAAVPVTINGKRYSCKRDAMKDLNISYSKLTKILNGAVNEDSF